MWDWRHVWLGFFQGKTLSKLRRFETFAAWTLLGLFIVQVLALGCCTDHWPLFIKVSKPWNFVSRLYSSFGASLSPCPSPPVSSNHKWQQLSHSATWWKPKENSNWGETLTRNCTRIMFSSSRMTESCRQRSVLRPMLIVHPSVILLFLFLPVFLIPRRCRHHSRHHLQCACQCL